MLFILYMIFTAIVIVQLLFDRNSIRLFTPKSLPLAFLVLTLPANLFYAGFIGVLDIRMIAISSLTLLAAGLVCLAWYAFRSLN